MGSDRQVFANSLGFGDRPAVLVVDMCRAFTDRAFTDPAGPGHGLHLDHRLQQPDHARGAPIRPSCDRFDGAL